MSKGSTSMSAAHELTADEERELHMERTALWARHGTVKPFTQAEARWHARRFIASNGKYNLVRLLAESYLRDTGAES